MKLVAIFVTFWKLNPGVPPAEVSRIAATLLQKGLYPPAGVKVLAWYLCPGGKGVSIVDIPNGDSATAFKSWLAWVMEKAVFSEYEAMPAITAEEAIKMVAAQAGKG
ncbi:MAG: hypothetical protein QHH00_04145 [Methanomassiliicoccales archaeon]|nr:hypothetical protein [Methanomassiliicoccales archaeon]